jgi:hypothetical protein
MAPCYCSMLGDWLNSFEINKILKQIELSKTLYTIIKMNNMRLNKKYHVALPCSATKYEKCWLPTYSS